MRSSRTLALVSAVSLASLLAGCSSSTPATTQASTSAPTASAAQTPTGAGEVQTIAYADASPTQTLQLYRPSDTTGPVPLVVLIHGGAFEMGDASMEADYARELVDNGFAVAAVNYRLSGEAAYPAGA